MIKEEVLRYLGHEGQVLDEDINHRIDTFLKELSSEGKFVYEIFEIEKTKSIQVVDTILELEGASIQNILKNIDRVVLFAATLGHGVDQKSAKLNYQSATDMMLFDACASARIEVVLDEMTGEINGYLTPRFSPGYGDLSIEYQKTIIQILNAEKKLGIKVTDSFLMLPKKSVTGIIGISDQPTDNHYRICDDCLLRTSCNQKICKRAK